MDCLHTRFYVLEPQYLESTGLGGRHKEVLYRMTVVKAPDMGRQGHLLTWVLSRTLFRHLQGIVNSAVFGSGGCVRADN